MIEQYQPEKIRLFNDPVAKELVGSLIKFLMQFAGMRNLTIQQADAVAKGIYGVQVCRTRYIDDVVQTAISQGIEQLVILVIPVSTENPVSPSAANADCWTAQNLRNVA